MPSLPVEVADFISGARVARLGTADKSGQPLVVPICFAFDGEALYSAIDAKPKTRPGGELQRIRNIRENPRVSIVIDHYDDEWERLRYVVIQGRATIVTDGAEYARGADLLIAKYPQYVALGLARDAGLMLRVDPETVRHWRFAPAAAAVGGAR